MTAPPRAALCAAALLMLSAPAAAARIERLDLAVTLDPTGGRLDVEVHAEVEGGGEFLVRLAPALAARDVAPHDDTLRFDLGAHGRHEIAFAYGGKLGGGGAEGRLGPRRAVADPGGSFVPAADWWPDFGAEPEAYRLAVTVPEGQVALASARLVEERRDEGYTAVFEGGGGEPPVLFAGPYEIAERRHGAVRLRAYFHAEVAALAEDYLDQAAAYIDMFAARIGAYPYADFRIVSAPFPVGLGFPATAYVGTRVLPLPFMRGRSLAHEILHNWWGNGVAADYRSGNWVEGLTTYQADYGLAELAGAEAAREMRLAWLRDIAALPADRDRAVASFTAPGHAAGQVIGYAKVAMIFHMLRGEIGDDAFDRALRRFWRDHNGAVAGWADLRAAFERASGRDLGWFFEQWLRRTGAPALRLDEARARAAGAGWELVVQIGQDGRAWRLGVPLALETDAGTEKRLVALDGAASATFGLAERPRAVAVDPDYDLLRALAPGEAPPIFRDVTLDAEARLVVAGDGRVAELAEALAARLLESEAVAAPIAGTVPDARSVLLIGVGDEVEAALTAAGLTTPESLAGRGTARAWVRRRDGGTLLVVAADDADALAALARPLPHYGGRSYVVFDGGRAIENGIWSAAADHALRLALD